MNINLTNYEAYFLDYHEGSLSPALVKELMEFISQHPEIKEEFESFESIALNEAEEISFDKKELLKKSSNGINAGNFDEYAIQQVEGILSPVLQNELKAFIRQNPQYKKDLDLYTKTKLVPENILFQDKFLLKKGNKKPYAYYYWSAAASVAIIIGIYFFLNRNVTPLPDRNNSVKHNQISDTTPVASHASNAIDSGSITPKVLPVIPVIKNAGKHKDVAVNTNYNIPHYRMGIITPTPKNAGDSLTIYLANLSSLPLKVQANIPFDVENATTVSYINIEDTTITSAWLNKYNSGKTNQQEVAGTEEPAEDRQGKFLYMVAKYACKGLHKITGQHIKMEKRYDSDTTNIIAYQLDLGNKKIEFPVKD